MKLTIYHDDNIISAVDAENGMFRARVQIEGFKLVPPQVELYVYLSPHTFESDTDAIHHGIAYYHSKTKTESDSSP